jgi:hypothetical protein
MKNRVKKLTLGRDTIKRLSKAQLDGAAGGPTGTCHCTALTQCCKSYPDICKPDLM